MADLSEPDHLSLTLGDLATALGTEHPAIPVGYVPFKGYLTRGNDGIRRLFMNDTFRSWLEVSEDDIEGRLEVPANAQDSRSVVFVHEDAKVVKCQLGKAVDIADDVDVWGADPGGGGPRPRRPPY